MQKSSKNDISGLIKDFTSKQGWCEYKIEKMSEQKSNDGKKINYKISNPGNKILVADLFVKSKVEAKNNHIVLKSGESYSFEINSRTDNDSIEINIDKEEMYPIKPYGTICGGGIVFKGQNGVVSFFNIINNTPFKKAGIEDGMKLLKIDNVNPNNLSFVELTYNLLKAPNSSIKLLVQKDNENKEMDNSSISTNFCL
jgi:hypothetical protein